MIKNSKKTQSLFLCIGLSVVVSACSGSDPLKKQPVDQSAKFLIKASLYAEKRLKLLNPGGYYYGECMRGKEDKSVCKKLYREMVHYAKNIEGYKNLTINELADANTYTRLGRAYESARFLGV